eukprot:CAMPEP_0196791374 /NCGR_PEP_ID=MMETSP1104-20130614/29775_1 /TAXON_ID=33652 /ORGANISM="Cafeteria sp., Strain Caron Lab Isolate" /LENGTH=58 /DNA_ID=CAMNT_0042161737 /DNA_START=17 /DNA_END=189 /DNA_ORIENTATION=-
MRGAREHRGERVVPFGRGNSAPSWQAPPRRQGLSVLPPQDLHLVKQQHVRARRALEVV